MYRSIGFGLFFLFLLNACSDAGYQSYQTDNISLDSTYNSNELENTIAPYRKEVDAAMNKIIGFADSALIKYAPESPLGNFTADITFEKGIQFHPKGFENLNKSNTISLLNFGGLRAPINQGEITIGNVYELMPFDNTVMLVKIKGSAMDDFLTYLYTMNGQPVSNCKFDLNPDSKKMYVNGALFDSNQDLFIITSNYLASGGDKMTFLRDAELKWDSGILLRDIFIEYITEKKQIKPAEIEGRMLISKE